MRESEIASLETDVLLPRGCEQILPSLDASGNAAMIVAKDGRIRYANKRCEKILGYKVQELVGLPLKTILPDSSLDLSANGLPGYFEAPFPLVLADGNSVMARHKSARDIPVDVFLSPVGDGSCACCIVRDISRWRLREDDLDSHGERLEKRLGNQSPELESQWRALQEKSQTFELILDSMSDGVVVVDLEGKFTLFNNAARQMIGRGPTDRPRSEWSSVFGMLHVDGVTPIEESQLPLVRGLHGESIDNFPLFIRNTERHDGIFLAASVRPVRDESNAIVGAVALLRNVDNQHRSDRALRDAREELERRVVERTLSLAKANRELSNEIDDRRQAEEALKASERQLRLMADSLPLLVAYVDSRQRYLFSNIAYEEWFGVRSDDTRGRPVWEVVGIERYKVIRPFIEEALAGTRVTTQFEVSHQKLGTRHLDMMLVPDSDADGLIQGFYAVGHDITERVRSDAAERKHREELAHVSRVATMGELTAALAHELNQPLTSIRSNAQAAQYLMKNDGIDEKELGEILVDIIADNRRASEVIQRLRSMLKKRPLTLEILSVNEVVRDTVSLVKNDALMRRITLDVDLMAEPDIVHADRIQLQQVLLNLIMNGFDAMRESPVEDKHLRILSIQEEGTHACVCVTDSGTGFSAGEDIEHLFKPFYTTKEEGMGMGLSINRTIIESMGGKIWGVNNPERGATFHFTLPLVS